jgi:MYXO-CTERM domain-containing protein
MRSIHLKACAIALAAAVSMPAFSQGSSTGATGTTTAPTDTTVRRDSDRGFDWGWLGLLGLAGLIGLRRQPDTTRAGTMRSAPQR